MAWDLRGDSTATERPQDSDFNAPGIVDQARYTRRGIAVAASFILAIIAAAAGGQALAPVFTCGAIAAMSPRRLRALYADALTAPLTLSLFILFLAWIAAATFWSPQTNPKTALAIIIYLPLFAVFVWCCRGDTKADRALIVRAGTAFVFLGSVLSLFEASAGFPFLLETRSQDAHGLFEAKRSLSVTAAGLAMLFWPVTAALDKSRADAHWLIFVPILAITITARLTGTSAVIVAMLFGGFCFLAARAYPTLSALIAGMTISSALLAVPRLADWLRFVPEPVALMIPTTYYHRIEIWKNAADLIAEKPWIGWGMDASKTFRQPHDFGPLGVQSLIPWHPHNAGLHIWLELGFIGAGLAAALTLSLTLLAIRRLASDRVAIAGLVATIGAFCVFATVSFGIWQAWFLSSAFTSMGLIVALASDRPSKHSL